MDTRHLIYCHVETMDRGLTRIRKTFSIRITVTNLAAVSSTPENYLVPTRRPRTSRNSSPASPIVRHAMMTTPSTLDYPLQG